MKTVHAVAAGVAGTLALVLLLPAFDAAQPAGLAVTRHEAKQIADETARRLGIDVDAAWPTISWEGNPLLDRELAPAPELRRRLVSDPAVGPRLGGFRVTYFRKGLEKYPEHGFVVVGVDGRVLGARRLSRKEVGGGKPTVDELRAEADRFVASRPFPGAPSPVFDSARPQVLASRTDHTLRYRVAGPAEPREVRLLLGVYFTGEKLTGWELIEEYRDGRAFRYDMGGGLATTFLRLASVFGLLFVLAAIFLKKYHAGEVGVGIGALLFAAVLALLFTADVLAAPAEAFGTNFGGTDARMTAVAMTAFKLLFFDVPFAALLFMGWAVGESTARERWGHRLASFDALFRRDARNATVGRSLLLGLLAAPAVAAASLAPPHAAVLLGKVRLALGPETFTALSSEAGPLANVLGAATGAAGLSVLGLLWALTSFQRRRLLPVGLVVAAAIGPLFGCAAAPVEPVGLQALLGFGAPLAAAALFLAADLLSAATALFGGSLLVGLLPLARAATGTPRAGVLLAIALPLALLLAVAVSGLATRRTIQYRHEDLAPHVRRIVERERVKAEIDAANRIQAALLPEPDPRFSGARVASHYGAATEIGGDYFDFLPLPGGALGLAFGDVAGHGLTSGIVMSMAKAALLVQTAHDSTPVRVMEVLNDVVMRTAPRRMTMTFFFGVLDLGTGELRFCSAGHLDPYVLRARDGSIDLLSAWGFPLGVRRREPFREQTVHLGPGDRLVLYSDGLIEAVDDEGEPFGFARFEEVLSRAGRETAEGIRTALLGAVRRFTRNRPPEDDQTLVVLAYEGNGLRKAAA